MGRARPLTYTASRGTPIQVQVFIVIPAKAGIQDFQSRETQDWTPAFAGVATSTDRVLV